MAFWAIYSGDFSSVQVRIEPDVLTSQLHGDTTLGPTKVFMDTGRCTLVVHSFPATFSVDDNGCCFPICRCVIIKVVKVNDLLPLFIGLLYLIVQ